MTLREAYGAALKAALGIIGFYIVFGIVTLLGVVMSLGSFLAGGAGALASASLDSFWAGGAGALAGAALALFGIIAAWLSAFAVIIKTSFDEAMRRSRRRIDDRALSIANQIEGRSASRGPLSEADSVRMSWRGAFGTALKAVFFIIISYIAFGFLTGVGAALTIGGAVLFVAGDVGVVVGAFAMIVGAPLAVCAAVAWILSPFANLIAIPVRETVKRSESRIAAAVRFITDSVDERSAEPSHAREAERESPRQGGQSASPKRAAPARHAREANVNRGGARGDVFLSKEGVTVTRTRFESRGAAYGMSAVSSCRVLYLNENQSGGKKALRALSMMASLAGSVAVGFMLEQPIIGAVIGITLAVAFSLIKIPQYRLYELYLYANSGEELRALTSRDGDFIREVERAVNDAIAARGNAE